MGSAFSSPTHVAVSAVPDVHECLVEVLLTPKNVGICQLCFPQTHDKIKWVIRETNKQTRGKDSLLLIISHPHQTKICMA